MVFSGKKAAKADLSFLEIGGKIIPLECKDKEIRMKKTVMAFCRRNHLLGQGERILVGLSGGADSVCLFLVLLALKEELSLSLAAVHVNHNLRGEEADADERFCEELCKKHGVEFHRVSVPVEELAKENGWTLEEAGRNARYSAFAEWKERLGCQKIAVAHHKNDQAETVLFQLFRGSRLKGLSGMEAKRGDIIRPLLCVTRKEIEEFLAEEGQSFCIDRTNLEEDYTRNCIRNKILPQAEALQKKTVEHVAETAEYLGRVERYLERQTRELYVCAAEGKDGEVSLSVDLLSGSEPLLAERVIYRALCAVAGQKKDITSVCVEQCMELLEKQTGRKIRLLQGLTAIREYGVIRIYKEKERELWQEIPVTEFPFFTEIPKLGGVLHLDLLEICGNTAETIEKMGGIPKSNYTKWYDYDTINSSVILRTATPEDEISLYVDGRGKRVFDVLADAKIPAGAREQMPVLAAGDRVLWIPGVRSSEAFRVTEKTKRILTANIIEKEQRDDGR